MLKQPMSCNRVIPRKSKVKTQICEVDYNEKQQPRGIFVETSLINLKWLNNLMYVLVESSILNVGPGIKNSSPTRLETCNIGPITCKLICTFPKTLP